MRKTCGNVVGSARKVWVHFVHFSIGQRHGHVVYVQKCVHFPHITHMQTRTFPLIKIVFLYLLSCYFSTSSTVPITTITI
jgi:hypothetical protein